MSPARKKSPCDKTSHAAEPSSTTPAAAATINTAVAASSAAAIIPNESDDAAVALRIHVIEQLTSVFNFSATAAQEAIDAVGADVEAACNYILDSGIGKDQGGTIVPIDNCPHMEDHVKLQLTQLPMQPHRAPCTYYEEQKGKSESVTSRAQAKSEIEDDGFCPSGENWLCLECGAIRCSRYVNGHGLAHWENTRRMAEGKVGGGSAEQSVGHCIAVSLADLSVWCHVCCAYLHHPNLKPLLENLENLKFQSEEDKTIVLETIDKK